MRSRLLISIGLVAVLVNLAAGATGSSLSKFIERASKGEASPFLTTDTADLLGVDRGAPSRHLEVQADQTTDERKHWADVILRDEKPLCLVLSAKKKEPKKFTVTHFRINVSGRLERAVQNVGFYDENGKAIQGTGVNGALDLKAKETKAALRHELDFWLKDMYRKPQPASSSSNP